MKYSVIKTDMGHVCRTCLNDHYGVSLSPRDCVYQLYPAVCVRCGEVKNIVERIRLMKRIQIRLMPAPSGRHRR